MVEIITQKKKNPSESWLGFVKTSAAKNRIRSALRTSAKTLVRKIPEKLEIKISVEDRLGLLKDISEVLSRSHVHILAINTQNDGARKKFAQIKIISPPLSKEKAEKLMVKLKKIKEVREVGYKLI